MQPTDYSPWGGVCRNQDGRGAYVLQGYILAESPWAEPAYNLGIYNCRPPSVHGEERAGDTGFPILPGPKAHPAGFELCEWLLKVKDFFGIQVLIWNRFIWSRLTPYWHPYHGPDPHLSHVHWELNWWGYWKLTDELLRQHLPTSPTPPTPEDDFVDVQQYNNMMSVGFGYTHIKQDITNQLLQKVLDKLGENVDIEKMEHDALEKIAANTVPASS